MIFAPDLADKIVRGDKTQTRRPARKACRYIAGRTYAVQPGRGQKGIARIRVIDVTQQLLGDITDGDAMAEGFASIVAFRQRWFHLYGTVDGSEPVWRIVFEVVE